MTSAALGPKSWHHSGKWHCPKSPGALGSPPASRRRSPAPAPEAPAAAVPTAAERPAACPSYRGAPARPRPDSADSSTNPSLLSTRRPSQTPSNLERFYHSRPVSFPSARNAHLLETKTPLASFPDEAPSSRSLGYLGKAPTETAIPIAHKAPWRTAALKARALLEKFLSEICKKNGVVRHRHFRETSFHGKTSPKRRKTRRFSKFSERVCLTISLFRQIFEPKINPGRHIQAGINPRLALLRSKRKRAAEATLSKKR